MPALSDRLDSLAARGAWLRTRGHWAMRGGVVLAALALYLWWPDPAGNESFESYAIVPAALARHLLDAGAGVRDESVGFLAGGTKLGFFSVVLLLFLGMQLLVARKVRSTVARWIIYTNSIPFLMVFGAIVCAPFAPTESLNTARVGIVVDHPGAPPAPADGTGRKPWPAFHLQPDGLPPLLADEGRYVLAQQAYFEGDPRRAATHLQHITGAWRPDHAIDRERIGVIDQWAAIHGYDAGTVAHEIGGGGPWSNLWRLSAWLAVLCGILLFAGGIALDIAGTGRKKRFDFLAGRLASAEAAPAPAPVPQAPARGFGRRALPLVNG